MFSQISERQFHRIRWILTVSWLLLLGSLFYDPISPWLTDPNGYSPISVVPEQCIPFQGGCLFGTSYYLAAPIFWGIVVPSSIFILLIFGHELWRRICPLSFLSQIPRALGWQRQIKRGTAKGARAEIARVKPDSWLGKNYPYLQFGWLFLGLCLRILIINGDRIALASWILLTIILAVVVGYFYGGKTWCNYFCPMAPVQRIYGEPRGLFASSAHLEDSKITQSMCRSVDSEGQEKSACIACQSPCIDIDSERTYWDALSSSRSSFLHYSYFGLVLGYFCYYYLYSGSWDYYFSGLWAMQDFTWKSVLDPGFYLFGVSLPIPKIIAVPFTLGTFTLSANWAGQQLEQWSRQKWAHLAPLDIQHRLQTLSTFLIFNFFFIFAGRFWLSFLPLWAHFFWEGIVLLGSGGWLWRTWGRSNQQYTRESLASRLRKQLSKLGLNLRQYLEGRDLKDLSADEVYVLAKVIPGFDREKRLRVYKELLRDVLEEGYVNSSSSLQVLGQTRVELQLNEDEHREILSELGIEDPGLLDPQRIHSLENSVRLNGYRKAMERVIRLQNRQSISDLLEQDPEAVRRLRQEYCITYQEEELILEGLDRGATEAHQSEHFLRLLQEQLARFDALNQPSLASQSMVLTLLRAAVKQKLVLLMRGLLELIERVSDQSLALHIAEGLDQCSPVFLADVLSNPQSQWEKRLPAPLFTLLKRESNPSISSVSTLSTEEILLHLKALLGDPAPLTQAVSLYLLSQLDPQSALPYAQLLLHQSPMPDRFHSVTQETAQRILSQPSKPETRLGLSHFPMLEKLSYLFNTQLFAGIHSDTLLELAELAYFKLYSTQDIISDEGDTCRELLLLLEGSAQLIVYEKDQVAVSSLLPGQLLDELEVLSHGKQSGRIIAVATPTRILAIPVDGLDQLFARDHDFARRVLEWESRRLQQLIGRNGV